LGKLWVSYVERVNPHLGIVLRHTNQYTALRQLGGAYVQQRYFMLFHLCRS